jgi:TRAP-type C4-dicarboxylate transport system substrate-binding protein
VEEIMRKVTWIPLIVATAALSLGTGKASAQAMVKLKVASGVAATHYLEAEGSQYWMKAVTDASGGRVQFEYYPGEQLGKVDKMMDLVQAGVVDIGAQSLAYTADKTPLSAVAELPGLVTTSCQGTAAYSAATQPGKAIFETDFKGQRLKPMFAVVLAQFKLLTSKKPVRELADFAGLKLRTAGGVGAIMTTALGAVPIHVTTPDVYQSFSRGTLDGVWLQFGGVKSYDLQTVAKYASSGFGFGAITYAWIISDRSWARLSPDVQAILEKSAHATAQHLCQSIDKDENTAMRSLADGGMEMISFSHDAQQAMQAKLAPVATQWAMDLDARGKPGSVALNEFSTALSQQAAKP